MQGIGETLSTFTKDRNNQPNLGMAQRFPLEHLLLFFLTQNTPKPIYLFCAVFVLRPSPITFVHHHDEFAIKMARGSDMAT